MYGVASPAARWCAERARRSRRRRARPASARATRVPASAPTRIAANTAPRSTDEPDAGETSTAATPASAARAGATRSSASLRLKRVGVALVADTAHREDQLGRGVVALDALAEPADVHVDRPRLDVRVAAPHQ